MNTVHWRRQGFGESAPETPWPVSNEGGLEALKASYKTAVWALSTPGYPRGLKPAARFVRG